MWKSADQFAVSFRDLNASDHGKLAATMSVSSENGQFGASSACSSVVIRRETKPRFPSARSYLISKIMLTDGLLHWRLLLFSAGNG